jgi:glutathione peroxidase
MRKYVLTIAFLIFSVCFINAQNSGNQIKKEDDMSIYKFTVKDQQGKDVSLEQYKGNVLLIINSATGCGFTPQYEELEKIYAKYKDQGFVILDFPCNQFAGQAPGTDEEIHNFCTLHYDVQFPQFSKIEVNGEYAIPLYKYLKEKQGFKGFDKENKMSGRMNKMLAKIDPDYMNNAEIKWNFTKFLVTRHGEVVARFEPTADLKVVEAAIQELLLL